MLLINSNLEFIVETHALACYIFTPGVGKEKANDCAMENNSVRAVRKGTWTEDEDNLLRKCIQMYGEGKWHLVPQRAGLKRCRKSCRLRWLNYLNPDIKRGPFSKDEVDLLIRLHKLLGNRWSLIAGRIPGRTGNDVKNFWNTHIADKLLAPTANMAQRNLVKPRPWKFSNSHLPSNPSPTSNIDRLDTSQPPNGVHKPDKDCPNKELHPSNEANECVKWWTNLLEMASNNVLKHNVEVPKQLGNGYQNAATSKGDVDEFGELVIENDIWELLSMW